MHWDERLESWGGHRRTADLPCSATCFIGLSCHLDVLAEVPLEAAKQDLPLARFKAV